MEKSEKNCFIYFERELANAHFKTIQGSFECKRGVAAFGSQKCEKIKFTWSPLKSLINQFIVHHVMIFILAKFVENNVLMT